MEIIFASVLVILTFSLWIWAIIDIVKSSFKNPVQKTLWLLLVLLFPILGSIFYFQLGRKYTNRKPRRFQPNLKTVE